jgi:hypothetical protein
MLQNDVPQTRKSLVQEQRRDRLVAQPSKGKASEPRDGLMDPEATDAPVYWRILQFELVSLLLAAGVARSLPAVELGISSDLSQLEQYVAI